ncbi:hypothetical protein C8J57DRAFT_1212600 [Mycena rebaudengoi]|nr:hypothetical protein C8J57DRAFT_1212600 [Mycena rebaudengoi]
MARWLAIQSCYPGPERSDCLGTTLFGFWNAESMGTDERFGLDGDTAVDEDDTEEFLAEIMQNAAISDPQIDDILNFEAVNHEKKSAEWSPYPSKMSYAIQDCEGKCLLHELPTNYNWKELGHCSRSTVLLSASDLTSNFLDLEDEKATPKWTDDTVKKGYPSCLPNPKRELAPGDRIYSSFIDYFGDDVSGNRSKSWNKHWNHHRAVPSIQICFSPTWQLLSQTSGFFGRFIRLAVIKLVWGNRDDRADALRARKGSKWASGVLAGDYARNYECYWNPLAIPTQRLLAPPHFFSTTPTPRFNFLYYMSSAFPVLVSHSLILLVGRRSSFSPPSSSMATSISPRSSALVISAPLSPLLPPPVLRRCTSLGPESFLATPAAE